MHLMNSKMGCFSLDDTDIEDDVPLDDQLLPTNLEQQELNSAFPYAIGVAAAVASLLLGRLMYQCNKTGTVSEGLSAPIL